MKKKKKKRENKQNVHFFSTCCHVFPQVASREREKEREYERINIIWQQKKKKYRFAENRMQSLASAVNSCEPESKLFAE